MAGFTAKQWDDLLAQFNLKPVTDDGIKDLKTSLQQKRITGLETLLQQAGNPAARARLSQKTGVPLEVFERLVVRADFMQLNLVKPDLLTVGEAALLERLEVDGLRGLARITDPAHLVHQLQTRPQQTDDLQLAKNPSEKVPALIEQAQIHINGENYIPIVTHQHNLLVVSDLHIGEGWQPNDGKLNRNEDFLYDADFAHFLVYHQQKRTAPPVQGTVHDRPWRLIINGDAVDFLQVTSAPAATVEELDKKVCQLLGQVENRPLPVASSWLDKHINQVMEQRHRLIHLENALHTAQNFPHVDPTAVRLLLAETDILMAAGDAAIDNSKLIDLEEYLRIPSELAYMTAQLQQQQSSRSPTQNDELAAQIWQVWKKLQQGSFDETFLNLLLELFKALPLQKPQEHETAADTNNPWIPDFETPAFERYYVVLKRYQYKQTTLCASLTDLSELTDIDRSKRDQLEQSIHNAIRRLIFEVAPWDAKHNDPHQLPYGLARWGLGSNAPQNVWRTLQIYAGHPLFFQGLAWHLAQGNELVIQTGNHDIELFWFEVRQTLREVLCDAFHRLHEPAWAQQFAAFGAADLSPTPACSNFSSIVTEKLSFTHWLYYEPGVVYVEHGNQYETANSWATYLDPSYVGTLAVHWIRTENNKLEPRENVYPKLFWPWGSLIVRYIFNQMEETHPFADQLKPMTRYFTWAINHDLLRALGLWLLSLPGIAQIIGQVLDRGTVEGWFGTSLSISGTINVVVRGAMVWFTWSGRFLRFLRTQSDADRRSLRFPVLPWEKWQEIVNKDRGRRYELATKLPQPSMTPSAIEKSILPLSSNQNQPATPAPNQAQPTTWQTRWCPIFGLALQGGLVLVTIALALALSGWRFPVSFGAIQSVGTVNGICRALSFNQQTYHIFGFLDEPGWWLVIAVGLIALPLLAVLVWPREPLANSPVWHVPLLSAMAIASLSTLVVVGRQIYCGFAYYTIPEPGPWASGSVLPRLLFWVALLALTFFLPGKQPHGKLWQPWRYRPAWENRRKVGDVGLVIIFLVVLLLFGAFYGAIDPDTYPDGWLVWLPWSLLLIWLWVVFAWRGHTPLIVFYAVAAAVGVLALLAQIMAFFNLSRPAYHPLWLALALPVLLVLYRLLAPRWQTAPIRRHLRLLIAIVALLNVIALALWLPNFYSAIVTHTGYDWLPLWALWGFIGLWLLESKENPFARPRPREGWLGEKYTSFHDLLQPALDSTFTFLLELGLLILLVGAAAHFLYGQGRPLPELLLSFVGGTREPATQMLIAAAILLVIGSGGRTILGALQTENFPLLLQRWQRRTGWLLTFGLGLGIVGLVVGAVILALGPDVLTIPQRGWSAVAILALLGLTAWARSTWINQTSNRQFHLILLATGGILLLLLWLYLLPQAGALVPDMLPGWFKWVWAVATLLVLLALFIGSTSHNTESFAPILNGASWGILLLAGIFATALIAQAATGRSFEGLVNLTPEDAVTTEQRLQQRLLDLRLANALRLSYAPAQVDTSDVRTLQRLREQDIALGRYFEELLQRPETLRAHVDTLAELSGTKLSDELSDDQKEQVDAAIAALAAIATSRGSLQPDEIREQIIRLQAAFPANREKLTAPKVELAREVLSLEAVARKWQQLTDRVACERPIFCEENVDLVVLGEIWQARWPASGSELLFIDNVNTKEQEIDDRLSDFWAAADLRDEMARFGLWERLHLATWLWLQGIDDTRLAHWPVSGVTAAGNPAVTAAELAQISAARQEQMGTLLALRGTLGQRNSIRLYINATALLIITAALVGISGTFIVTLVSVKQPLPPGLTAVEQVERINRLGQRMQRNFVRRIAGTLTTLLSLTFAVGLIVGAYFIVNGLLAGDWVTTLGSGATLTLVSVLGRRLIMLIPTEVTHGQGYLTEVAGEISALLDRGQAQNDQDTALYHVPYLLFGHDHNPTYSWLSRSRTGSPRWYVNSGAWVQAYTGEVRQRREDEDHAIFVEIVPGSAATAASRPPRLLRWDGQAGRPAPLNGLIKTTPESVSRRVVKTTLRWLGLHHSQTRPSQPEAHD